MKCRPKRVDLFNFLVTTLVLIFVLAETAFAKKAKDIYIYGNTLEYDKNAGNITVSGNVKIVYSGYNILSSYALFDIESKVLEFPYKFNIIRASQNISADRMVYDFSKYKGTAHKLYAEMEEMTIKGDKVSFETDKITIEGADFTSCNLRDPHYLIKAREIHLYPAWGFFVSFDNIMQTHLLPFSPWLPTYIHGSTTYSMLGSSTPVPELGSNHREGGYIKQKYGYFLNEKSTGTLDFGYTQNLGLFAGFSHGYVVDEKSYINLRIHYLERDDFEGGLEYNYEIIEEEHDTSEKETDIEGFFSKFSIRQDLPSTKIKVLLQHREIIHDSRVSYRPFTGISVSQFDLLQTGWITSGEISAAKILEEAVARDGTLVREIESGKASLYGKFGKKFNLQQKLDLDTDLYFFGDWYGNNDKWQRMFISAKMSWETPVLRPCISYTKKLYNNGKTPFEFERIYALQHDEIGIELLQDFGDLEAALVMNYEIEQKNFRNLNAVLYFDMHCMRLSLIWETIRGQFSFGFEIM
ncbi:MAG: LPS-assembly protein LptD [bacterium]|nr:LPS-assembly protein LptD [bacterium]